MCSGTIPPFASQFFDVEAIASRTSVISEAMLPGHVSLPNGYGLDHRGADGLSTTPGVAPNALTSTDWRDAYAGTPWHKHVPVRIEAVESAAV